MTGWWRRLVKRDVLRKDLLFFLPFCVVFTAGCFLSGADLTKRSLAAGVELAPRPSGVVLIGLGLLLELVACFTLGRNDSSFVVIHHDHRLVTHGLYARIRHPIHLGVLIVSLGIAWCAASWKGALVLSLLVPLFVYRMRIEEELLTEEFGDAYREYAKRTARLLPGLY